jgi:predicted nucleotidyltransferase
VEDFSAIQNYLKGQPVRRAYLFGSYARGEQDTASDFDLLVELEDHVGLYKFVAIQLGLENLLGKKVDLVSEKGLSPRLRPYIDKDKRLIYERQPGR